MALARKRQINIEATRFYHCVSRCVRRAYLCGLDPVSGRNYEHRRSWVQNKLLELPNSFAIDVYAFAVMNNHTHSVLYVNHQKAQNWCAQEVLSRWHRLFKGTILTQRYTKNAGRGMSEAELRMVEDTVEVYRSRLMDISWFMRSLNEFVARKANKEDNCTGRFWEGRFKSQALLDEQAVLCCMVYVDLNPHRVGIASSIKTSHYTSIKLRENANRSGSIITKLQYLTEKNISGLAISESSYIQLVSDRIHDFSSEKSSETSSMANVIRDKWYSSTTYFEDLFHGAVGNTESLTRFCKCFGSKRRSNLSNNRKYFGDGSTSFKNPLHLARTELVLQT
ncbi:transposase [Psychrosphaera sp. B3R10]|uniref:transposase n=1 Tax=unclassified Psychrosphaera TaxID=2641570 RepID=UPI001C087F35|nr:MULTISPECIES: transposase [unclassified Psychrosphaera]MBU2880513.1 transposase [Psychrosphaera sp. I2R16]MBU2989605.1 transposase [Psychrosphaera sp. B3R10]